MITSSLYGLVLTTAALGLPLLMMAQPLGATISWSVATELPSSAVGTNLGVAGPFTGVSGDALLVAGGANFPNGKPWEGGKKEYSDALYVVRMRPENSFTCTIAPNFRLPEKIAYGCSVTIPAGIVCIGGETPAGYSASVYLLSWQRDTASIRHLPALPHARANACATAIGSRIYVFGGEDALHPLADGYSLDLDAVAPAWEPLPPLPVAMSHSVALAQSGPYIYIIGGRSKTDSGISDLHSSLYRFDLRRLVWHRLADIGDGHQTSPLSAATAIAVQDGLLVFGGDHGDIFHQIEVCNSRIAGAKSESTKKQYTQRKLHLVNDHPGFSHDILFYATAKDSWTKVGALPGAGAVTTTAVIWNGAVFIPSGEIRPGVRSARILRGVIGNKPNKQ